MEAYGVYKLYDWCAKRPKVEPSDCRKISTGTKVAIGGAIAGARGAVLKEVTGTSGALRGGTTGWVIGFGGAVIASPVVDPAIKAALSALFQGLNAQVTRTACELCEGQNPTVWPLP